MTENISQSEKWYSFLNGLYSKFSEYEIQKERKKYNVADIDDWGQSQKPQGIVIDKSNLGTFLGKLNEYNLTEYDDIESMGITHEQLEELNHVLNVTLNHKMQIRCIEPYMFVKGDYISIKNIVDDSFIDIDDSCREFFFTKKFSHINVFALNTFFIDEDVPLSREMAVTVIAPKWEVIGSRKFEFNGSKGNDSDSDDESSWITFFKTRIKAKDSPYPGGNGDDGKPGGPGGIGGTYFGVGENFVNGQYLTISANGGIGGTGQDGGNGGNGTDGSSPQVPSNLSCRDYLCDHGKKIDLFKCEKRDCSYWPKISAGVISYELIGCNYIIYGSPGQTGGNGGDGGRGGIGGHPGTIMLFELNEPSSILKQTMTGEEGENGKGGICGRGGINGNDLEVSCNKQFMFFSSWYLEKWIYQGRSTSGKNGIDGGNTRNRDAPKVQSSIVFQPYKIINQYKSYLRENFNDPFKNIYLTNFLKQLENNYDVKNIYDTLGFIDEFQSLEKQFHIFNNDVNYLPFYQSLLNRINEYAQNSKEINHFSQHKKVLSYLYTAVLGRIHNLKDNLESNLIIDIFEHLNIVKRDIDKFKDVENSKNRIDIINKYKQEYKKGIDTKVKEAKELISKQIIPEIENIDTDIDKMITSLIDEVQNLQEQSRTKHKELNEKKRKLENAFLLQSLFTSIKIIGQVASFLGPMGDIAGSVISAGSSVAESFLLNDNEEELSNSQLIQSISDLESLKGRILGIGTQKITRLNKLLENTSVEINKYPEKLGYLSVKITNIQSRLNEINVNMVKFKEIEALEYELEEVFENQSIELRKEITDNEETKNALRTIDNLKKTVQLSTLMVNIYSKYKNNRAKLDIINKAIENLEVEFENLKQYEKKIYDTIIPIVQNIGYDIDNIISKLNTRSKVALDVTKWQVQSNLNEIKSHMQQLTKGFTMEDNLALCIEKLMDAMTSLIIVYNHIEKYQEHQQFANFIADISSITADQIHIINNPELTEDFRNAIRDLEVTVRSSVVLKIYQTTIDAFKQFVFPFAHFYLKGIMLPSHLKLERDVNNLIHQAATEIDHIKSGLENYKKSLLKHDKCIGTGEFNSDGISIEPFFIWENIHHKNMISKLLSGDEVIVKADILNSVDQKEEAIKFNVIELNFKSKNESIQSEINQVLEAFKVSMTHLGNSYYRYNNKIYQITTNSQDIWYYSAKRNGEPTRKSASYNKIKKGDFMLSPYTLWKLKLTLLRNRNNFSFKDLEIYKNEIDLELWGNGSYVDKTEDGCLELEVENYYQEITAYDVTTDAVNSSLLQNSDPSRYKRDIDNKYISVYQNSQAGEFKRKQKCIFYMGDEISEISDCATNDASPSISSPINFVCNWLKENSSNFLSSVFKSVNVLPSAIVETIFTRGADMYHDTLEIMQQVLGKEVPIVREKMVNNEKMSFMDFKEFGIHTKKEQGAIKYSLDDIDDTLKSLRLKKELHAKEIAKFDETVASHHPETELQVALHTDDNTEFVSDNVSNSFQNFILNNNSNLLMLGKNSNFPFVQNLDIYGSIMLANVISRSVTGETLCKKVRYSSPMIERTIKINQMEHKVLKGLQKMAAFYDGHEFTDL